VETIFFTILAVFNITFFKGQLYRCISDNIPSQYLVDSSFLKTKQDCMNYGGDWVNSDQHFDNVANSLVVVFQMATTEGWVDVMNKIKDSNGIDMMQIQDNQPLWGLFIMLQIIVTNFLMLNFFAGVVIESFNQERDRTGGQLLLTKCQREWIELQRYIMRLEPLQACRRPTNVCWARLFDFYFSEKGHQFGNVMLVIMTVPFAMRYHRMSQEYEDLVESLLLASLVMFIMELVFKLIVIGTEIKKEKAWFGDVCLLFCEILGVYLARGYDDTYDSETNWLVYINLLRNVRILRMFKLWWLVEDARIIFDVFWFSLPAMANVGIVLLVVMFMYAVFGMDVFAFIKHRDGITSHANFENFGLAFMTLFRLATVESWNEIMDNC
jgi:hypothetical protein